MQVLGSGFIVLFAVDLPHGTCYFKILTILSLIDFLIIQILQEMCSFTNYNSLSIDDVCDILCYC